MNNKVMNLKSIKPHIYFILFSFLMVSCGKEDVVHTENKESEVGHHPEEGVVFTAAQASALGMDVGSLPSKSMSGTIQVNGMLEVPPQNEALITSIIGANITSIHVIEGDEVKKGQILAYISHPNLIRLQSEYLETYNTMQYTIQEYQRQKKLYEEEVGSGKVFQQVQADLNAAQGLLKSYASQFRILGIDPDKVREGDFFEKVAIRSPIDGSIVNVLVKNGQFVQPDKELFEIINTDHIHIKLMVFEKDAHLVEKGQRVRFTSGSGSETPLYAEIFSISKKFEQNTRAIQVHAEIQGDYPHLVPGMYVKGQILTLPGESTVLPEAALVREGGRRYAFRAEKMGADNDIKWVFTRIEVIVGESVDNWVEVKFLEEIPGNVQFALNNGYYIMAEMKKGELDHDH